MHASRRPSRNPGAGRYQAHVRCDRFDDDSRHVGAQFGDDVVGGDKGLGDRAFRDASRGWQAQRRHPAPAARQQPVAVPVVTAFEKHDPVAPGRSACQPDG